MEDRVRPSRAIVEVVWDGAGDFDYPLVRVQPEYSWEGFRERGIYPTVKDTQEKRMMYLSDPAIQKGV